MFEVGDKVRYNQVKNPLSKGYKQGWSDDIFVVVGRLPRIPPVYKLAMDATNEEVDGTYYAEELSKVL